MRENNLNLKWFNIDILCLYFHIFIIVIEKLNYSFKSEKKYK
jgi:hypothetical protein